MPIKLINEYKEETGLLRVHTSSDSSEDTYLKPIVDFGGTRLSERLNSLIFNLINELGKRCEQQVVFLLNYTNYGVFNTLRTLNDKNFGHLYADFDVAPNLFWETQNEDIKKTSDRSKLYLCDFSAERQPTPMPGRLYLRSMLEATTSNDLVIYAATQTELGECGKGGIRSIVAEKECSIDGIFFFQKDEEIGTLAPEADSRNRIDTFDEGLYLLAIRRNPPSKQFVAKIRVDSNFPEIVSNYLKESHLNDNSIAIFKPHSPSEFSLVGNNKTKEFYPAPEFLRGVWLGYDDFTGLDVYNKRLELSEQLPTYEKFKFLSLNNILSKAEIVNFNVNSGYREFDDSADKSWIGFFSEEIDTFDNYETIIINSKSPPRFNGTVLILFINSEVASAEYLSAFFSQSTLGKLILQTAPRSKGDYISKENILDLKVPLPPIKKQNLISELLSKVHIAASKLEELAIDSLIDDESSNYVENKIHQVLEVFEELSDGDRLKTLIKNGESRSLEFKQTLSWCIRQNKKASYIQEEVIGTIAAFLNTTGGGTLLIGVSDKAEIIGIEPELKSLSSTNDKYLLSLDSLFTSHIGTEFNSFVDWKLIHLSGKTILQVVCRKSSKPVWAGKDSLFVRTNPATHKLSGPALLAYIKENFPDN